MLAAQSSVCTCKLKLFPCPCRHHIRPSNVCYCNKLLLVYPSLCLFMNLCRTLRGSFPLIKWATEEAGASKSAHLCPVSHAPASSVTTGRRVGHTQEELWNLLHHNIFKLLQAVCCRSCISVEWSSLSLIELKPSYQTD